MRLTKKYMKKILRNPRQLPANYSFNKGLKSGEIRILNACRNAVKIITYFFTPIGAFSSKPVFTISNKKVNIKVFYYRPKSALNYNSINNLGELLSKVFNRRVELEFVRLHYPHLNSQILAEILRLNARKYNFNKLKLYLFKKRIVNSLPLNFQIIGQIVGMKIEISGRLVTERSKPRKTISTVQSGSIYSDNKNYLVDFGSYTNKNAQGAYTVKVWIGQRVSPF